MSKFIYRPIATFLALLLLSLPLLAQGYKATGRREFLKSGTFVVPGGISSVTVRLWGAGNPGNGTSNLTSAVLSVSPGQMLIITVGGTDAADTTGDTFVADVSNTVLAVSHGGNNVQKGQPGTALVIWAKESQSKIGSAK